MRSGEQELVLVRAGEEMPNQHLSSLLAHSPPDIKVGPPAEFKTPPIAVTHRVTEKIGEDDVVGVIVPYTGE